MHRVRTLLRLACPMKEAQIVLRLSAELEGRVVAFAERLRTETGLEVTRSEAARRLLTLGLEAAGEPAPKRKR